MPKPDTANYYAGGFQLYAAQWSGDTPPTLPDDYGHLGNAPGFSTEPRFEELVHESSMGAVLTEDASRVTKRTLTIKVTLDELDVDNVATFFGANKEDASTVSLLEGWPGTFTIKMVSSADEGPAWTIELWKVRLKPSGALDWGKIKKWAFLELEGKVLADVEHHPTRRFGVASLASV
jgi:hypothetical protein